MDKKQFTGKNLDEALAEAASFFSVHKDLLCYHVLQTPSAGLLSRLFSRQIRIEAWVETAKEDLQAAAREAVRQALTSNTKNQNSPMTTLKNNEKESPYKKRKQRLWIAEKNLTRAQAQVNAQSQVRNFFPVSDPNVLELFDNYQNLFFSAFQISQDQVEVVHSENELVVRVNDEGIEKYLSKSDKLSLAFEHVFKRISQKKLGDINARISLEAGDSSDKREERLVGMARSLAEKVKKTGKSVVLSSKSSQERRIIHLALDGFSGVATRSVGTGDKRRLVIYSTEKKINPKHSSSQLTKNEKVNENNASGTTNRQKPKRKNHFKGTKNNFQNKERVGASVSGNEMDKSNVDKRISLSQDLKEE